MSFKLPTISLGRPLLIITILSVVGVLLLMSIQAGKDSLGLETESSSSRTDGAKLLTSSSASNGKYIEFQNQNGSATGEFSLNGSTIIDPDGKPFYPIGPNLVGKNVWDSSNSASSSTASKAGSIANDWDFNIIRLMTCPSPKSGNQWATCFTGGSRNNDTDEIIREYTSRKVVVMINIHAWGADSGAIVDCPKPDPYMRQAAISYYKDLSKKHGDNPYVWFNFWNEPVAWNQNLQDWKDIHYELMDAARGSGSKNMFVLDDMNCATGGRWWQNQGSSAILTAGNEAKARDPLNRTMFAIHGYSFGFENGNRLVEFDNIMKQRGHAYLVGEFSNIGAGSQQAADTIFRELPKRGVGLLGWVGSYASDGYGFVKAPDGSASYPVDRINSGSNPTNLTYMGSKFWEISQNKPF